MLKQKTYKNGQKTYELKDQVMTVFFNNGLIKARGPFVDRQMEGEWMFYKKSGELWQIGHFLHNQKHGEWIYYTKEGNVEKKAQFMNGKQKK